MKKFARPGLAVGLVALTVALFAYYLTRHRYLLHQLAHTSPLAVVALLGLYTLWFGALVLIMQATLGLCRRAALPGQESLLLNAYSTLVNFFVPGQSGPVVRGLYLKKRHGLKFRVYILATFFYYSLYAAISAVLLLARSRPWWQTLLALVVIGALSNLAIRLYSRRRRIEQTALDLSPAKLGYLLLATVLQATVQVIIYMVELHTVNRHISLAQTITYTGAANFALFVALTPGAIGIRESFLLLSRRLHHISSANIIAASLVDRAVFIIFLVILFALTLGFHAKAKLQLKDATRNGN
jgi:uncharacterized membrane protein YbhN (UPF0104 family)